MNLLTKWRGLKMDDYKIKINNELVSVNKEIYLVYYKMRRREKYLKEVSLAKNLSYNQLLDKDFPVELKMSVPQTSVEDIIIKKLMIEKIKNTFDMLADNEKFIIYEIFFKGTSIRVLSNCLHIPKSTLHEQKKKIIKKLRKLIEKS